MDPELNDVGGSNDGGNDFGGFDIAGGVDEIASGLFGDDDRQSGSTAGDDDGLLDGMGDGDPADAKPGDPAGKPAANVAPGNDPAKPGITAAPAGEGALAAPKTWTKEAQDKWATTDPVIQKEIIKREEDMFRGLEQYKGAANFGNSMHAVIKPYEHILAHYKIDPVQQVASLLKTHQALALGSEDDKVVMMRQIMQAYNVPAGRVMEEPAYEDPQVVALRRENQRLQSIANQSTQAVADTNKATAERTFDAFASDPKNVHFDDVASDMVPFIQAGSSLEEAYAKAIWANPVTRVKEIARQTAEDGAKRAAEDKAKVEAARRATSANVRSSVKSGSAAAPLGNIEDTMRDTLASIRARA